MEITNIHDNWGATITLSDPLEFFKLEKMYWRNMLYEKKLLVFKKMNFSLLDYAKFAYYFGNPWQENDYKYSLEKSVLVPDVDKTYCITEFSNFTNNRIGDSTMPWHADIPNKNTNPFPHRSIWITKNPNPEISGQTRWLNIEDGIEYLSPKLKELIPRVKILQQSWYQQGTDEKLFDFIKVHPITNKQSLRLNYYVTPKHLNAWIKEVYIDNVKQNDCSLIQEYIDELLLYPELIYQHVWDTYDIAIYDNYSFVHGRTKLVLGNTDNTSERKFYRINIDHVTEQQFLENVVTAI